MTTHKPWRSLARRTLHEQRPWLAAGSEDFALPDGQVVNDFTWVESNDWIAVVAFTVAGEVVLERCYKPGVGRVSLVVPAGGLGKDEDPLACARRELLEETGYSGGRWEPLGTFVLDPNYRLSAGHLFLARDVVRTAEPASGDLEEIEVVLLPWPEALAAARAGELGTMGSVAAIGLAALALTT